VVKHPEKQNYPIRDRVLCINILHLDRLFHKVQNCDGLSLGVIDIYLDAPDYTLVYDETEGFTCLDDISRALIFYIKYYKQNKDNRTLQKITSLLNTIFYLRSDNGYFYNFLFSDLTINRTHINSTATSNFWSWRAMLALSEVQLAGIPELQHFDDNISKAIDSLVSNLMPLVEDNKELVNYSELKIQGFVGIIGADQIADIISSLTNCYLKSPKKELKKLIEILGNGLLGVQFGSESIFPHFTFLSWKNKWHAWGNSQSGALIYSGRVINNTAFVEAGLKEVRYFYPYLIRNNYLSSFELKLTNNKLQAYNIKQFPQIAYDIRTMVYASIGAFANTNNTVFANIAAELTMWFFGKNAAKSIMYDCKTGRCFDGIDSPTIVNKNSGAESTIETLLLLIEIEKYPVIKEAITKLIKKEYE